MQRIHREIARDAARLAGVPLAQVLVIRAPEGERRAETLAAEGAALGPAARAAVLALLSRTPGDGPAAPLLDAATAARVIAPCEDALEALLRPAAGGARAPFDSVFYRLGGAGTDVQVLRLVVAGRARGATLRALDALARLAAGRLDAETGRRELAGRDAAYRLFQESAGEAILVADATTGRILEGNQKLTELTGWAPRELRRMALSRVLEHPLHDPGALLGALASARVVRDDEAQLRRRRGEPVPVALTAARIEVGDRAVLHVIARDVARERRALAEARQAKDTLAALHLAGAHLMVETDEDAIYGVLARELLRLGFHSGVLMPAPGEPGLAWRFTSFPSPLQRAMERVLGRPLEALRIDAHAVPLLRRCLSEGRTLYTERARPVMQALLGGATPRQLRHLARLVGLRRVVLAPLRRDGRTAGVLAVAAVRLRKSDPEAIDAFALQASIALEKARLVTALREERARLETEVDRRTRELRLAVHALEELDRRKDNFLANISHELRTPLVTVLGYADLLVADKLGELAPRQRQAAQVIAASGRRLKTFIEELLEFSRHELAGPTLHRARVDVADVLTAAVVALAPRYAERRLRVRARVVRGTPPVFADRERIVQVLVNLLGNAERYSPEGSSVRVAAARGRPGTVEVAVSDRGAGIAPEHVEHIFDRLYQVRDDRAPRHKGGALGLGLAIVKSIVEAHGGEVRVRSRVGRGTSFRFTLPVLDPASAEPTPAPVPPAAAAEG